MKIKIIVLLVVLSLFAVLYFLQQSPEAPELSVEKKSESSVGVFVPEEAKVLEAEKSAFDLPIPQSENIPSPFSEVVMDQNLSPHRSPLQSVEAADDSDYDDVQSTKETPSPDGQVQGEKGEAAAKKTSQNLLKEVPGSYPIQNAQDFFVPAEERYPGNLGGPPPLVLPSRTTSENIEAPSAPSTDTLAPPSSPSE